MGSWGVGSFENDDAMDWVSDYSKAPSVTAVKEALATVAERGRDEYLEMAEAGTALAAAEVVAALSGRPSADLPGQIGVWVGKRRAKFSPRLIFLARQAVARVRSKSELGDNWIDEATGRDWYKAVADLETRLTQTEA